MKKFFSLVLALVMALSLTTVAWGAVTGTGTEADPYVVTTNQEFMDLLMGTNGVTQAAEGSYIQLTAGTYKYYEGNRFNNGITILGGTDVKMNGFHVSNQWSLATPDAPSGLTFKNITFTAGAGTSGMNAVDWTFEKCTFEGARIVFEKSRNVAANVTNLTVKDCTFGATTNTGGGTIYSANYLNGATIIGNTINDAGYNAIQFGGTVVGNIVISDNTITNTVDRAIRMGAVATGASLTITDNTVVNGTDGAGEVMKAGSIAADVTVKAWNNDFDGGTVVNDELADIGSGVATDGSGKFTAGTFAAAPAAADVADGYTVLENTDGTYVVVPAVTMGDKFDLYLADAGMNAALKAKAPDVAGLSFTEVAAKTNKDGSGNVAYIAANNGQFFVKTSAPTVSDFAVTDAGKNTVLYYVTVAGTDAANFAYEASVTAFNKFSTYDKCGYVTATPAAGDVYFQTATGVVYKAAPTVGAVAANNYLLNGKVVTAAAAQTVVDHNFTASGYKYDSVKKVNVPTSAICTKCQMTSTAIYLDGKAPAQSTVYELVSDTAYCVVAGAVVSAPVVGGTTVESAQTFDAGIAMYVGMSVLAATGSAVVIGKKKD